MLTKIKHNIITSSFSHLRNIAHRWLVGAKKPTKTHQVFDDNEPEVTEAITRYCAQTVDPRDDPMSYLNIHETLRRFYHYHPFLPPSGAGGNQISSKTYLELGRLLESRNGYAHQSVVTEIAQWLQWCHKQGLSQPNDTAWDTTARAVILLWYLPCYCNTWEQWRTVRITMRISQKEKINISYKNINGKRYAFPTMSALPINTVFLRKLIGVMAH